MKRYEIYNNTDISWSPEVPAHWKTKRAKWLFSNVSDKNHPKERLLSATQEFGVYPRDLLEERVTMPMGELQGFKLVKKGDYVISLRSFQGGIEYSDYQGLVSPAYTVLRRRNDIDDKYFKYLFKSSVFIQELNTAISGIREGKNIVYDDFADLIIPVPSLEEQRKVGIYLEKKLGQIDTFIKNKQRLIELLEEQKAAVINQAITKGLDSNVKMKHCGVEWLDEIPAHWSILRMKHLGTSIIGLTYSPSEITDQNKGTLVFRSSNVQNGQIDYSDCVYVAKDIPEKLVTKEGDILICSRNGSASLVGKNALIDEKAAGNTFGAFMTIFRTNHNSFLHYFFNSSSFKAQSGSFSTSTINQLTTSILNNIKVAMPPTVEEQNSITDYIRNETSQIDEAIRKIIDEIALLNEYRTTLISEVVTGKIDVRTAV